MPELQAIVERVAEAMGPVEERERDENEKIEPRHRVLYEGAKELVAGRFEPPERKREPIQEEMDRKQESGDGPSRAEQEPQKRRDRSMHLASQENPGDGRRQDEPGHVVQACDDPIGHPLAPEPHHHGLGGQIEPGDGMEHDKDKGNTVEGNEERRLQAGEEVSVGLRALDQRTELPQRDQREEGHEDARELAQDEAGVGPALQPPPDRDAAAVPPGMVQGVVGPGAHLVPQGRSKDLNQWTAPASLYCWMAPAGSTFFGQTFVHSPTNVHCQMPSWPERISRRSAA